MNKILLSVLFLMVLVILTPIKAHTLSRKGHLKGNGYGPYPPNSVCSRACQNWGGSNCHHSDAYNYVCSQANCDSNGYSVYGVSLKFIPDC